MIGLKAVTNGTKHMFKMYIWERKKECALSFANRELLFFVYAIVPTLKQVTEVIDDTKDTTKDHLFIWCYYLILRLDGAEKGFPCMWSTDIVNGRDVKSCKLKSHS